MPILSTEPELLDVFQAKGEAVFLGHLQVKKPNLPAAALRAQNEQPSQIEITETTMPASLALVALKQATRRKIQLGGLIIKANLALLNKAQLLGALVTLRQAIGHKNLLPFIAVDNNKKIKEKSE